MRYISTLSFICASLAFAIGISVSPGTFVIQDVPIGEQYDISKRVGYTIRISGVSHQTKFILTPRKPSEDGTIATGYYDFPNPEWFSLECDSVDVSPEKAGEVAIWVYLPDDPSLYNRHFLLGVDVSPTVETTRGMLAVGAYLLYRFETLPKADIVPRLQYDELAFVPSAVVFDSLKIGDNRSVNVRVHSGSEAKQTLKLYRLDPESDVAKLTILVTPGFQRAPEGLVFFPEKINLDESGGKLFVQAAISKEMSYPRLEEIIMVENSNGNKAFLRVRLIR